MALSSVVEPGREDLLHVPDLPLDGLGLADVVARVVLAGNRPEGDLGLPLRLRRFSPRP